MENGSLRGDDSSSSYPLRPLGEAAKVVAAGGLFAYARQNGLVRERSGPA